MTLFRYAAARVDGARVRGRLEAPSAGDAAAMLADRGLFPLDLRELAAAAAWRWRRPSARARAVVLASLAALVEAGVPVERALDASAAVTTGALREAVARIGARVREGAALAAAFDAERGLLSPVVIGLLRGAEHGVGLAAGVRAAAEHVERDAEVEARLRAALAYPALLLTVGVASVALITLVIVPRFAVLLRDVETSLPIATRALLAVSGGARTYWLAAVLASVVAGAGVAWVVAVRPVQCARFLLEAPVIGRLRHRFATARVCSTLGALLAAGVPALAGLRAARDAAGDAEVARRLETLHDRVAEGSTLSAAAAATHAVTPLAVQLITIGEGAGRLPELLLRAAALEAGAAERQLAALVRALEPALILVFAALVAFVAAALLQAVYSVRPGP